MPIKIGIDDLSSAFDGELEVTSQAIGSTIVYETTPPFPDTMKALWDFNDPNETIAVDKIAGRTLSLSNIAKVPSRNGLGISNTTSAGMANVSDSELNSDSFSVICWVLMTKQTSGVRFKFGGAGGTIVRGIYARYNVINNNASLAVSGQMMTGGVLKSATNTENLRIPLPEPTWKMLSMTYDGTTLLSYIDDEIKASASPGGLPDPADFFEVYLTGTDTSIIDDVKLYSICLSQSEIVDLFNE